MHHASLESVRKEREIDAKVSGPLVTGASKLTQTGKTESVSQGFNESVTKGRNIVYPLDPFSGGVSDVYGEILAVNPGPKVGRQTQQIRGHLSQLFMNTTKDMEYQSMLVNGRIFVVANARTAIETFRAKTLRDFLDAAAKDIVPDNADSSKVRAYKLGSVAAALRMDPAGDEDLSRQQADGANTPAEYELGHHVDYGSRSSSESLLGIRREQAMKAMAMHGPFFPAKAVEFVEDSAYRGSVILVETPTEKGGTPNRHWRWSWS